MKETNRHVCNEWPRQDICAKFSAQVSQKESNAGREFSQQRFFIQQDCGLWNEIMTAQRMIWLRNWACWRFFSPSSPCGFRAETFHVIVQENSFLYSRCLNKRKNHQKIITPQLDNEFQSKAVFRKCRSYVSTCSWNFKCSAHQIFWQILKVDNHGLTKKIFSQLSLILGVWEHFTFFFCESHHSHTSPEEKNIFSGGVLGLFLCHGQLQSGIIVNMPMSCVRLLEVLKINYFNWDTKL